MASHPTIHRTATVLLMPLVLFCGALKGTQEESWIYVKPIQSGSMLEIKQRVATFGPISEDRWKDGCSLQIMDNDAAATTTALELVIGAQPCTGLDLIETKSFTKKTLADFSSKLSALPIRYMRLEGFGIMPKSETRFQGKLDTLLKNVAHLEHFAWHPSKDPNVRESLDNDALTTISEHLKQLKMLVITIENHFDCGGIQELTNIPTLKHLGIRNVSTSCVPEGSNKINKEDSAFVGAFLVPQLENLLLTHGTGISKEHAAAIRKHNDEKKLATSLKTLCLSQSDINDETLFDLLNLFTEPPTRLELEGCKQLSRDAIRVLFRIYEKAAQPLHHLSVKDSCDITYWSLMALKGRFPALEFSEGMMEYVTLNHKKDTWGNSILGFNIEKSLPWLPQPAEQADSPNKTQEMDAVNPQAKAPEVPAQPSPEIPEPDSKVETPELAVAEVPVQPILEVEQEDSLLQSFPYPISVEVPMLHMLAFAQQASPPRAETPAVTPKVEVVRTPEPQLPTIIATVVPVAEPKIEVTSTPKPIEAPKVQETPVVAAKPVETPVIIAKPEPVVAAAKPVETPKSLETPVPVKAPRRTASPKPVEAPKVESTSKLVEAPKAENTPKPEPKAAAKASAVPPKTTAMNCVPEGAQSSTAVPARTSTPTLVREPDLSFPFSYAEMVKTQTLKRLSTRGSFENN